MRIIQHTNNGKEWLLVEVPKGAYNFKVFQLLEGVNLIYNTKGINYVALPAGSYGKPMKANELTEEQYSDLLEIFKYTKNRFDIPYHVTPYVDYVNIGNYFQRQDYALKSLLQFHKLKPETTIIIKKLN